MSRRDRTKLGRHGIGDGSRQPLAQLRRRYSCGLGLTGTAGGVAHFAHLGGMVGGYLLIRSWRSRRGL